MAEDKEKKEVVAPVEKPEPKTEKVSKELVIKDSELYSAEVIERFGKTSIGTVIEKKGSIIKVLLEKKLIKLI